MVGYHHQIGQADHLADSKGPGVHLEILEDPNVIASVIHPSKTGRLDDHDPCPPGSRDLYHFYGLDLGRDVDLHHGHAEGGLHPRASQ